MMEETVAANENVCSYKSELFSEDMRGYNSDKGWIPVKYDQLQHCLCFGRPGGRNRNMVEERDNRPLFPVAGN